MKAITIWQPWASLIMAGIKHIETRPRNTCIRGRIVIHAGANGHWLQSPTPEIRRYTRGGEPLGCILGTVDLIDCIPLEDMPEKYPHLYTPREIDLGDWSPGRYGLILRDPIVYPNPIPAKGKQGWWNWGAE